MIIEIKSKNKCNCGRELNNVTGWHYKLTSLILEGDPEIIICEQCLFEKLLNKKIKINEQRYYDATNKKRNPLWNWFFNLRRVPIKWRDIVKST